MWNSEETEVWDNTDCYSKTESWSLAARNFSSPYNNWEKLTPSPPKSSHK